MIDLRNEREINVWDRDKPQILTANNHIENAHLAIGFASRCWKEDGTFDVTEALRLVNELCAYMRLIQTPLNNLEYIEWLQHKKNIKI